jgi:hypothetical protein
MLFPRSSPPGHQGTTQTQQVKGAEKKQDTEHRSGENKVHGQLVKEIKLPHYLLYHIYSLI